MKDVAYKGKTITILIKSMSGAMDGGGGGGTEYRACVNGIDVTNRLNLSMISSEEEMIQRSKDYIDEHNR